MKSGPKRKDDRDTHKHCKVRNALKFSLEPECRTPIEQNTR